MKRTAFFGLAAAALVLVADSSGQAGRIGGPLSTVGAVSSTMSIFYDIRFAGGKQAVVSVAGNGSSVLELIIYDSDGHTVSGVGRGDQKTATMDVYRAGVFRVEVRNTGAAADAFTLTTN